MWKNDDKGELNKLFKDIKVNKYISNLSYYDESNNADDYLNEKVTKDEIEIIKNLKMFIFDIIYMYFIINDSINGLYYFDPNDGIEITENYYNFLRYSCMNYEYGFIDTSIKDV